LTKLNHYRAWAPGAG